MKRTLENTENYDINGKQIKIDTYRQDWTGVEAKRNWNPGEKTMARTTYTGVLFVDGKEEATTGPFMKSQARNKFERIVRQKKITSLINTFYA